MEEKIKTLDGVNISLKLTNQEYKTAKWVSLQITIASNTDSAHSVSFDLNNIEKEDLIELSNKIGRLAEKID